MKKIFSLLLISSICSTVHASELDCQIESKKADLQATLLSSPQAFANAGDANTNSKSLITGVTQSLTGIYRAKLLKESAQAKCEAFELQKEVESIYEDFRKNIEHDAALTELNQIQSAIDYSKKVFLDVENKVKHQEATVAQLSDVLLLQSGLYSSKAMLEKQVAQIQPKNLVSADSVVDLTDKLISAQSRAMELDAKSIAESGWDLSISAGVKKALDNGTTSGFVAINAKYSFGLSKAEKAASELAALIKKKSQESETGIVKTVEREKFVILGLLKAEQSQEEFLIRELEQTVNIINSIKSINSDLSQTTLSVLELKRNIAAAKLAGVVVRLNGYQELLERLK